jgi:tRNA(fMet)-specific endonuclease VapC
VSWLLDTNIWSDFFRGGRAIGRKLSAAPSARVLLAAPVLYELRRGAPVKNARAWQGAVDSLVQTYVVLPLDADSAEAAYAIAADLRARGRHIHHLDTLIAGIAMNAGAILVTRDKAFSGVKGLPTEVW